MSKIYEAFSRRHGEPDLIGEEQESLPRSTADRESRFLKPGAHVGVDLLDAEANISSSFEVSDPRLVDFDFDDIVEAERDRVPAGHAYTIDLDDVRSVSAAIRSAARGAKAPSIGFTSLGNSRTGTALVRDLAAYEARLQHIDVLLVDVDRIRQAQLRFYNVKIAESSFDNARKNADWRSCIAGGVSAGVDFVNFGDESPDGADARATNKATYRPFIEFCKANYDLSLFDLPADGPRSEAHAISQSLDVVIVLCDVNTDTNVVNRFIRDLKLAAVRVVGAVTIR